MRRSKLELYLDVLEVFANNRPMRLTSVSLKAKISYVLLKKITQKLIADNLVEEHRLEDFTVYTATPKAKLVLLRLEEVKQSFPSLEEYLLNT
jgi:predicted transcriptional regulator